MVTVLLFYGVASHFFKGIQKNKFRGSKNCGETQKFKTSFVDFFVKLTTMSNVCYLRMTKCCHAEVLH